VASTLPARGFESPKEITRIAIVGCSGAGKSVLARVLGDKLKLSVVHLDTLFWLPGWKETPQDRFEQLQRETLQAPRWVVDGNYYDSLHIRAEMADVIVFLDFPRYTCLYRAIKRRLIHRTAPRPCLASGCPEKLEWEFLRWIWDYRSRIRPQILAFLATWSSDTRIVHLRNPRELRAWLTSLT
jgi:adenylate kinase family enzyme